ncbi:MAG: serine/threonine protein kinase [Chitinivibrionales bacterium]|nr:serine/threonine protein kinase [Chitinivibrionales bacterium]
MNSQSNRYSQTNNDSNNQGPDSFDLYIDIEPNTGSKDFLHDMSSNKYNSHSSVNNHVSLPQQSGTPVNGISAMVSGAKIGSGTIISMIGRGGMTIVYKIWNQELEMYRAVKVLLPSPNRELQERFVTEAKICAKLNHPNIITIYSVGHMQDLDFIEMEYVDGSTLDALLYTHKRLPSMICCAIGLTVASALQYMHSSKVQLYGTVYNGIIHRDLKPSNIMVRTDGLTKVMDFGVARPSEASLHTIGPGDNIMGSLQYMAPETLNNEPLDQSIDIYSFGAMLYEMLTGNKMFPFTTLTSLLQMKSINQYRDLDEFNIPINPQLKAIARTCLATAKQERYANASILYQHLYALLRQYTREEPQDIIRAFLENGSATLMQSTPSEVEIKKDAVEEPIREQAPQRYLSVFKWIALTTLAAASLALVTILIVTLLK